VIVYSPPSAIIGCNTYDLYNWEARCNIIFLPISILWAEQSRISIFFLDNFNRIIIMPMLIPIEINQEIPPQCFDIT
jgi:hypothetical protein